MNLGTVSVTLNEAQDDKYSDYIGIIKDLLVKVHDGYMFSASHDFGTIASSGGTADVLLQTPSSKNIHILTKHFNVDSTPSTTCMFEGTTVTDVGSNPDVSPKNISRQSDNSNDLTINVGPTVDSIGTKVSMQAVTANKESADNPVVNGLEWILKNDTNYLLRYTNNSNNDSSICLMTLSWYED